MSTIRYPRVFSIALCFALTVPTSIAGAANGEFRYSGGVLTCDSSAQPPDQHPPYMVCLQIGPIQIGETLRTVSMKFGKARKTVKRGDVTERLYPIALNVPAGHPVPYWVIGFEGQRVISIQITGDLLVDQYTFSSIRVGDPARSRGTKAARISRPRSFRTGIVCRFGSFDCIRPVAVQAWL